MVVLQRKMQILVRFEQGAYILKYFNQVKYFILSLWHLCKVRKLGSDSRKSIDLFNQIFGYPFKKSVIMLIPFLFCFLQILYVEFHWCERILNLVCNLFGHIAPCRFTFRPGQQFSAFGQFNNLVIVFLNQCANFIFGLIVNLFALFAQLNAS